MMRVFVVGAFAFGTTGAASDSVDERPTSDLKGVTCESPPIISYHVHGAWDARDPSLSRAAKEIFTAFADFMKAPAGICPFSHANAAGFYDEVCSFPFDWSSVENATNATSGLFGAMNHAYFVPRPKYMQAMDWMRQHHGVLHYMMHANTGCEFPDHSTWSMKSNNYPAYDQSLDGLWCCKTGPPGCTCDMVFYRLAAAPTTCLSYEKRAKGVRLGPCRDAPLDWGSATTWRETNFTDVFRQIEVYDTPSGGGGPDHQGLCLAAERCDPGSEVVVVECRRADSALARAAWTGPTSTAAAVRGDLRSDSCPGLCFVPGPDSESDASVVLGPCGGDAWSRVFLD